MGHSSFFILHECRLSYISQPQSPIDDNYGARSESAPFVPVDANPHLLWQMQSQEEMALLSRLKNWFLFFRGQASLFREKPHEDHPHGNGDENIAYANQPHGGNPHAPNIVKKQ